MVPHVSAHTVPVMSLPTDGEGEIDLPSREIKGLHMEDQRGVLDVPITDLLPEFDLLSYPSSSLRAE